MKIVRQTDRSFSCKTAQKVCECLVEITCEIMEWPVQSLQTKRLLKNGVTPSGVLAGGAGGGQLPP